MAQAKSPKPSYPKPALASRSDALAATVLKWLGILVLAFTLSHLGWQVASYKLTISRDIQFIGHADEAAYVTMGRSLAQGRGLSVDYVSWFFIPYSPEITRREDHWPPFMGFAIAPFFHFFGDEPWVSKIAPILIGSLGLPLAAAGLGLALSRRGYVALAAGLLMLANTMIFTESLKTLSDIATAALLAAFCAAIIGARYCKWLHLLAGAFLALTYFSKGSQIVLLGLYPLMVLLIEDEREEIYPHIFAALAVAWAYYLREWPAWVLLLYPLGIIAFSTGRTLWPWIKRRWFHKGLRGMTARTSPLQWKVHYALLALQIVVAVAALVAYGQLNQPLVLTVALPLLILGVVGLPTFFKSKWPLLGMATALLIMAPFLWSTYKNYGKPLHSTQNFVSGYMDFEGWEEGTYKPYWGKNLPATTDRWNPESPWNQRRGGVDAGYWTFVAGSREFYARCALLGPATQNGRDDPWLDLGPWGVAARDFLRQPPEIAENTNRPRRNNRFREPPPPPEAKNWRDWQDPVSAVPGVTAAAWFPALTGLTLLGLILAWLFRWLRPRLNWLPFATPVAPIGPAPAEAARHRTPWLLGPTLALVILLVIQWLFLVHFWGRGAMGRQAFLFLPLLAAIACTGAARLLEWPISGAVGLVRYLRPGRVPRVAAYWHVPLTIAACVYVLVWTADPFNRAWLHQQLEKNERTGGWPYKDRDQHTIALGNWIGKNLPNAVFMSRYCWQTLYYAAPTNRAVNIPRPDGNSPDEIIAIAKYYKVTHYIDDGDRPQMRRLLNERNGFRRLQDAPGRALYEIDWNNPYLANIPAATADTLLPDNTSSAMR